MSKLIFKDEVYAIVGAAMEVYNVLGPGFLEAVYQESLEIELRQRGIPFNAQHPIAVHYKGTLLKSRYVADFLVYGQIVVEIKAIAELTVREQAQLLNYLKAGKFPLGLLINFGHKEKLEWKRMANTRSGKPSFQ